MKTKHLLLIGLGMLALYLWGKKRMADDAAVLDGTDNTDGNGAGGGTGNGAGGATVADASTGTLTGIPDPNAVPAWFAKIIPGHGYTFAEWQHRNPGRSIDDYKVWITSELAQHPEIANP